MFITTFRKEDVLPLVIIISDFRRSFVKLAGDYGNRLSSNWELSKMIGMVSRALFTWDETRTPKLCRCIKHVFCLLIPFLHDLVFDFPRILFLLAKTRHHIPVFLYYRTINSIFKATQTNLSWVYFTFIALLGKFTSRSSSIKKGHGRESWLGIEQDLSFGPFCGWLLRIGWQGSKRLLLCG